MTNLAAMSAAVSRIFLQKEIASVAVASLQSLQQQHMWQFGDNYSFSPSFSSFGVWKRGRGTVRWMCVCSM